MLLPLVLLTLASDYDVLIQNARIIDGTGNAWFRGDLGVKAGRIAAIGNLKGKTADRTIDAANRVATPGFIDVHTHVEGNIEESPSADNYLLDGVTTIVTGNCGGSVINVGDWFRKLEQLGIGLNVATLIGHNGVRSEVMGRANRPATPDEIARMQGIIDRAMRDGAVGFSTGLIYIPGTYSNTDEVVALAKAASKYGGVYASHMRNEGEEILSAIREAVTVGKESGLRVQLSHFKINTPKIWGFSEQSLALVEQYRQQGVDVVVDQYPYDRTSTNLGIMLPSWALADGPAKVTERIQDPATRKKILADMKAFVTGRGHTDYSFATVAAYRPEPKYNGKTISEINLLLSRPRGLDSEAETILDMMVKGGAQMIYLSMGDVDIERILRYPQTAIASDGGIQTTGRGMPHPRSFGTNAKVLAEWVRDRKVLTLEDAIRRMTSLPARTFAFHDRGILKEGAAADILIFDPVKVQDKSTFTDPHHYSEGFDYVLVNGKLAVENGKLTAGRHGVALRRADTSR
ncbi:aminoacylase [Bryobacterales bacterium F-183]|nr:aminoacylase [Bryobacterales bacterium F-183]